MAARVFSPLSMSIDARRRARDRRTPIHLD
jgi:hypothetical protein